MRTRQKKNIPNELLSIFTIIFLLCLLNRFFFFLWYLSEMTGDYSGDFLFRRMVTIISIIRTYPYRVETRRNAIRRYSTAVPKKGNHENGARPAIKITILYSSQTLATDSARSM